VIIPPLFLYFLPFCYPYILLHFKCFFFLVEINIEFMGITFRAKQPQQLDSARTKPTVPNPLQCFGPLLGHIARVKRTPQQPLLYQVDGLLDQLDRLLNQLDPLTTEAKRWMQEVSIVRPLQEHALAEVLNGLTGQLNGVVSRLDRPDKRMESIEKVIIS